jgi:transcription elongation factor GreA
MDKIFVTKEGFDKLNEELNDLVHNQLPQILKEVEEARAQGDLSENADYDAARDKQAKTQGRIDQLREQIANAEIISTNGNTDEVKLGSYVTLFLGFKNKEEEYHIVGSTEANPLDFKISNECELAKAILGHKVGETITVKSNKQYDVKIVSISATSKK